MNTYNDRAWAGPSRPCVWCSQPCWNAWQECNEHSRRHPWRGLKWQRMVARLEMHERWRVQYLSRHPKHDCLALRAQLRANRLRWHWGGRHGIGHSHDFDRIWGLRVRPNPHAPQYEIRGGVVLRKETA